MREDFLKEQLMRYADSAAEEAVQPGAAEIYRRARRHYQRVAALTVAGMMLATGLGVGFGLRGGGITPTVNNPVPPATNPAPAHVGVPKSFIAPNWPDNRLAVVSTATGTTIRLLPTVPGSVEAATHDSIYSVVRACLDNSGNYQTGIYRTPLAGGQSVKLLNDMASSLAVSPDGSRLAEIAGPRACTAGKPLALVIRNLASGTQQRWSIPSSEGAGSLSLSPDGRHLAMMVTTKPDQWPGELRILDLDQSQGRSIEDATPVPAPDAGCRITLARYGPPSGRLAVLEHCGTAGHGDSLRLLYLDGTTGAVRARPLVLSGARFPRCCLGMAFDTTGRYLLLGSGQGDNVVQQPFLVWLWKGQGQPVRIAKNYTYNLYW
jgi:hypothetical protein